MQQGCAEDAGRLQRQPGTERKSNLERTGQVQRQLINAERHNNKDN
jgi:hypothetical protein